MDSRWHARTPTTRRRARPGTRTAGRNASCDLQSERGGDDMAVDTALQEEPPLSGHGYQHADPQLAGRRRAPGDLRGAEEARAPARAGSADVGMEVVERALTEEDRV